MYKTIIFDLGRVLVYFDFKRGYKALEPHCRHRADEIPKLIGATGLVTQFESGQIEPRDFVDRLSQALDLQLDYDQFCEIWSCIFTHPLVPDSMLQGLRARYRLIMLSNTNAIHFDMIRANYAGMLRHFDDLVLSYEVKALKPATAIFEAALAKAGCKPEECFYADDIAEYIAAARKLGIDAVQFETAEQLERELQSRGIEWK